MRRVLVAILLVLQTNVSLAAQTTSDQEKGWLEWVGRFGRDLAVGIGGAVIGDRITDHMREERGRSPSPQPDRPNNPPSNNDNNGSDPSPVAHPAPNQ